MIRVLLADDQALVRSGFRLILERDDGIEVVAEAENGDEAVKLARDHRPDVVLMDVRMPGTDGIAATRLLIDDPTFSGRVLMLTTFDLDDHVYGAIRAGASGFLLKDVLPSDLLHAIRVVARGESLLAPTLTKRLLDRFVARHPVEDSRFADLTERELEVALAVARGLSNAEIGKELFLSHATVKTHVTRVLTKLGVRDRVQVVVAAYESGRVTPGLKDTP
ncbi:MAG TPA: response regulator transcription factor [Gaiellaceae bacterium]